MFNFLKPGNKHFLSVTIVVVVASIAFWNINHIFFQQDEWFGLGSAISRNETGGFSKLIQDVFTPTSRLFRFLPMTALLNFLVFNLFGANTGYYGVLALVFLVANSTIVYFIGVKLTKSSLVGLVTSVLWLTNSLSYQAVTWISAMTSSQPSFLFFMVSFYLLILFIEKPRRVNLLIISVAAILVSLFFKENSAFYILVFLILVWFFAPKIKKFGKIRASLILAVPLTVALLIPRIIVSKNSDFIIPVVVTQASNQNIIYNAFLLPARSLYQVYFPYKETYRQILKAKTIHYSEADGTVIESLVADSYLLLVAFWFLFIVFLVTLIANKKFKKLIIFTLISFFVSTLPFILYENKIAFIEQRYFIFPAFWASLLITISFYSIFSRSPKIRTLFMIIIFIPLIFINVNNIRQKLDEDVYIGSYRKGILETISEIKPKLTNHNVFYFFTDHTGFWEFQSGFGQTLGVWLYDTGKIPRQVLIDNDFWDSSYEGLKEYPTGKYGYFMTYDKLVVGLLENPDIELASVHAYYWDLQKHTVENVSDEIRLSLDEDLDIR